MYIKFWQQHCNVHICKGLKTLQSAGFKPGIFSFGGGRDDHFAPPPEQALLIADFRIIFQDVSGHTDESDCSRIDQRFKISRRDNRNNQSVIRTGLPDGLFSNQKFQFG
jgi:hypothetical protein